MMAFILIVVIVAAVLHASFGLLWALPFWVAAAFLVYLNRNPDRSISYSPLAVVSPIDGQIEAISKAHDPYLDREAIRISLRMHSLGPYTIRSPTEGKIVEQWFPPIHHEADIQAQVRFSLWVQTDEKDDVVLAVGRGSMILHPVTRTQAGERLGQGQYCGKARFPVKVEVYVPVGTRIEVTSGDTIMAGADIATLIHG